MPNANLEYTTVDEFTSWISENFAGILSNDNPNQYTVDKDEEEVIEIALAYGEARVNGALSKRGYDTPISDDYPQTLDMLIIYVYNLAVYELYGRRGITETQYFKYKRATQELRRISEGVLDLPEDLPTPDGASPTGGSKFTAVFGEANDIDKNTI